ncbi:MAG: GTPase HflX [Lentisphaeria bacterium]|nr:GTPase HflX [Lentisphaeria bacterium]MBR7119893.1 GTPase HflX [Lentisphaeria bacterium]
MIEVAAEYEGPVRRAMLVGLAGKDDDINLISEQLDELAELVKNLGIVPLEPEIVKVREYHVRYRMGTGKAEEVAQLAQECEADLVVFDSDLTPSQQRNWERLVKCPVIGREEVILDIFAERAQTKEAVLQVELARSRYFLPRLTKAWGHFSRQRGGSATTRGEGEAQIETDRRLLKRRIQQLEQELSVVRKQRDVQRKSRNRKPVVQGAIVGYTNVGKSSLLKALTGADIFVKDQLFATLDPVARKIKLDGNLEIVLTDTVGFVRKLPHALIEAFKSTLEEAVLADFLLLVLDISSADLDNEWETTMNVLRELGADEKRITVVFNKIDRIDREKDAVMLSRINGLFPNALYVSAATGEGMDELLKTLSALSSDARKLLTVEIPPTRHDLVAFIHANAQIYEEEYLDDGSLRAVFAVEEKYHNKFTEYSV